MDENHKQIYQQIPGGLLLINKQGIVEFANHYVESLLGYKQNGLEGAVLKNFT